MKLSLVILFLFYPTTVHPTNIHTEELWFPNALDLIILKKIGKCVVRASIYNSPLHSIHVMHHNIILQPTVIKYWVINIFNALSMICGAPHYTRHGSFYVLICIVIFKLNFFSFLITYCSTIN